MNVTPENFNQVVVGIMIDRDITDPAEFLSVARELYTELSLKNDELAVMYNSIREENLKLTQTISGYTDIKQTLMVELEQLIPFLKSSPKDALDIPGIERVIEILKK